MEIELEYPRGQIKSYHVALYDVEKDEYIAPEDCEGALLAQGYKPGNPYQIERMKKENAHIRKINLQNLERICQLKKIINCVRYHVKEYENVIDPVHKETAFTG